MANKDHQTVSPLRLPAPVILGAVVLLFFAEARHARLNEYLAFLSPEGLQRLVLPFWEMTSNAFFTHSLHLLEFFWLTFVFAGTGRELSHLLRIRYTNAWEKLAFGFALSTGIWALLFLALGFAGLLYRPILLALLVAGTLWPIFGFFKATPKLTTEFWSVLRMNAVTSPWILLLTLNLAFLLPHVLVPETFYDSLEYHLGLPNLYLMAHKIGPLYDNSFSGVPSIPSMLYGWALAIDPVGVVAHMLSFSFLVWALIAVVGIALRLGMPQAGIVAASIFAAVPVVMSSATITTVELAWAFYQLLCFPALLTAFESARSSIDRRNWFALSGACLGLAMSTKYLAWPLPFAFLLFFVAARRQDGLIRPDVKELGLVAGVAALVLSPWVLKNVVFYHNPIFPFFQEWWFPKSEAMPDWRYLSAGSSIGAGSGGAWSYLCSYVARLWDLVYYKELPSGSIGPAVLSLLPLIGLIRLPPRDKLLFYFSLGCWLPLSFKLNVPRYYIPTLLPFCLLLALTLTRLKKSWLKNALLTTASLAAFILCIASYRWNFPLTSFEVFTGKKSYDELLRRVGGYYVSPMYAAAQYVNEQTSPEAKILVFGDARGFYLRRDHITSTPGQVTILERWANASDSAEELKAKFDANRVTHIIVNHCEFVRSNTALHFSHHGLDVLDKFWKVYTKKLFQFDPNEPMEDQSGIHTKFMVVVYEVLSEQEAARPHASDVLFADYNINGR